MFEIPKEVADAIEIQQKEDEAWKMNLLCNMWLKSLVSMTKSEKIIYGWLKNKHFMDYNVMLQMLANGYTVKQEDITVTITVEQQDDLRIDYKNSLSLEQEAIRGTLKWLGIKIDGVN